jgi:hypothetical protein
MAENKKWSQWSIIESTDIDSTTRFPVLDGSSNYAIVWGDLTTGLLYKIQQSLFATYTQVDYTADTENYLNLGLSASYRYVEIEYIMERGTKYRGGLIKVVHDGTTSYATDNYQATEDDCTWAIVQPEVNGGTQMQIQIDCDNSDANDTKFKYRIVKQIPVAD